MDGGGLDMDTTRDQRVTSKSSPSHCPLLDGFKSSLSGSRRAAGLHAGSCSKSPYCMII